MKQVVKMRYSSRELSAQTQELNFVININFKIKSIS